jgi:hypothetical protein
MIAAERGQQGFEKSAAGQNGWDFHGVVSHWVKGFKIPGRPSRSCTAG